MENFVLLIHEVGKMFNSFEKLQIKEIRLCSSSQSTVLFDPDLCFVFIPQPIIVSSVAVHFSNSSLNSL